MTALLDATLFPIRPNGDFPIRTPRGWRTDVIATRSGKENRSSIVNAPIRRIEYTATLYEPARLALFRSLWVAAAERLRFLVPLWPDWVEPTSLPDASTINLDTTENEFVEGEYALLWLDNDRFELVTIDTLASGSIATAAPFDAAWLTYNPAALRVIPVLRAWLEPPTQEQHTSVAEDIPLAFAEEPTGVAGLDATVGASITPTAVTLSIMTDEAGSPNDPKRFYTVSAYVFDAAGQEIQDAPVTWTVTQTGTLPLSDPSVHLSYPRRGRQLHMTYSGDVNASFRVDAASGAATSFTLFG